MNGIADGSCLHHLNYLLEFLAAWEKRPAYLTLMAYQWCSAISEAARRPSPNKISTSLPDPLQRILQYRLRLRPQGRFPITTESGFSQVRSCRDPVRLDPTSNLTNGHPQHVTPPIYPYLLSITLEIGFRHITSSCHQPALHLNHTSHHEWVLETAFSSDDDEVIADAVCVWIVGGDSSPPGSCARHLARRMESGTPFSPRLQQASIRAIQHIWPNELKVAGLDTVRWLNRLNVNVGDMVDQERWARLLVGVIHFPTGPESLSSRYWCLLDKLVVASKLVLPLEQRDAEVMRSLAADRARD